MSTERKRKKRKKEKKDNNKLYVDSESDHSTKKTLQVENCE